MTIATKLAIFLFLTFVSLMPTTANVIDLGSHEKLDTEDAERNLDGGINLDNDDSNYKADVPAPVTVQDLDDDLYDDNFGDVHLHAGTGAGNSNGNTITKLKDPNQGVGSGSGSGSPATQKNGHWGKPLTTKVENSSSTTTTHKHTFVHKDKTDTNNKGNNDTILDLSDSEAHTITHPPPDAFTIDAIIKQKGGKSYFHIDTTDSTTTPSIPFIECNSVGTTTPPIPAGTVSFRSFPKSAHPKTWTYTHGFIVPLSSIEIEVQTTSIADANVNVNTEGDDEDSEKKKTFKAGETIWVDGKYRMSSADNEQDLSALIINVPKKDNKSHNIFGLLKRENINMKNCNEGDWTKENRFPMGVVKSLAKDVRGNVPVRKTILATLGISLSSMLTYFWVKVAPLQLAVGVGGSCLIAGGSLGIIKGGEMLCDEIEGYLQQVKEEREEVGDADDDENI